MTTKNKLKYLFLLSVLVAAGFALADALGFFNPKPYTAVSHGSHYHYVPDNRDSEVGINKFPMEEPGPGEIITSEGKIVKKSKWKQQQTSSVKDPEREKTEDEEIRTIEIIGTDQMKFVVKEEGEQIVTGRLLKSFDGNSYLMLNQIKAEPGEQLRIRLMTLSQLEARTMSHNWVLLDKRADPRAFVSAANRENGYIPPDKEEEIISNTGMAGDGETVEVTFTAPVESGRYPFICSFMAHFSAGMQGTLIVE